jgi:hypothetical protein
LDDDASEHDVPASVGCVESIRDRCHCPTNRLNDESSYIGGDKYNRVYVKSNQFIMLLPSDIAYKA